MKTQSALQKKHLLYVLNTVPVTWLFNDFALSINYSSFFFFKKNWHLLKKLHANLFWSIHYSTRILKKHFVKNDLSKVSVTDSYFLRSFFIKNFQIHLR